jgi:hypothetical protein
MFGSTFDFKNSQGIKLSKNCNPYDFYLPTHVKLTLPSTSPNLVHNLLSGQLWAPLLFIKHLKFVY